MDYPELEPSRDQFARFVQALPHKGPIGLLCDGDVDGLGAGVTLAHGLERLGVGASRLKNLHVPKGGNAFSPQTQAVVAKADVAALFVLDLGVRPFEIAPVPTLIVDHHRPQPAPAGAVAICGYDWEPAPTSSLLTYLLCSPLAGLEDVAWKAALGNVGDLGPPYPPFDAIIRAQTKKAFDEAKALINTAKRSSYPDAAIPLAYRALYEAQSAKALATSKSEGVQKLRQWQAEVKEEFARVRRLAPRFSKTQPIALFRFSSPARVHPLLAQSWRNRLPKFVVLAANDGFVPGRVNFSTRTASEVNLLDMLEAYGRELGIDEPEYGLGHNQASGGSLEQQMFERLLQKMGF